MTGDRTIPFETLSRMVSVVDPEATVRRAELARAGHLSVYHLVADAPQGAASWVLKASPDGERRGIDAEARILSLLEERTSIPAPAVRGVVDAHETLPAPFFLMERLEGESLPKRKIGELPDPVLERVARETGRYLAELHATDGPEGYGRVDIDRARPLAGERPSVDPDRLVVADLQGSSSSHDTAWPSVLRTWAEEALERSESTRFGAQTEEMRSVLLESIESMEGAFRSVLGRVDHGLHNLLLDAETGAITGVVDWAFTLSVPPAYDLACVEANLSSGPWSVHPETPRRRELVRTKLLEGYRAVERAPSIDELHRYRSAYELLAVVRAMNHLDTVPELAMPDATEEQADAAAREYRELVDELLRSANG